MVTISLLVALPPPLPPPRRVPHFGNGGAAALDNAAAAALRMGLVKPGGHIVCLERFSNTLGVHVTEAGLQEAGEAVRCARRKAGGWGCGGAACRFRGAIRPRVAPAARVCPRPHRPSLC
jgi:hypothetical protein